MMKRGRMQHHPESTRDKLQRYKGVIVVVSLPIILIILVLFMMPRPTDDGFSPVGKKHRKIDSGTNSVGNRYAVIFDAGSSGSRVHVFCFDKNLDLVHIGNDLELFDALKPGLSAYAASPQDAARSLVPLLEKAEKVVPKDQRGVTPVKVGATAGLRALEGDAPDRILQAVRDLLKDKSDFKSESDWVTVLDGTQEGAYQWVTVNYLLGYVGQPYSGTVGVVDLGGGSVQMAYAISDSDAANAPTVTGGQDSYVKDMYLRGQKYHLYIHSYLRYGLLAARAEILKVVGDASNPCILAGYQGTYKYGGDDYKVAASPMGGNVEECKVMARRALKINESTCTHMKCTFNGVWNGGGGDGQKNLFVASFFFDRAAEAGFIDPKKPVAEVRPSQFADAAKKACETKLDEGKAKYPDAEEGNLPYLCMDLTYQYVLLVDGFGLDPSQSMTLVKRVPYRDSQVEAAWPLGSAIEAMSALA